MDTKSLTTPEIQAMLDRLKEKRKKNQMANSAKAEHTGLHVVGLSGSKLFCHHCDAEWCEHIERAITTAYDVTLLWDETRDVDYYDLLQVPLFPTEGLFTVVDVSERLSKGVGRKVIYHPDPSWSPEPDVLGFFMPGEGMAVLRSMLFDWFANGLEGVMFTRQCQSASHKYLQESLWQKHMNDPKKKPVQLWSLFLRHMCLGCSKADQTSLDDLVPEVTRGARPWA